MSKKALDQILEHSFESERDLARISVDAESVQHELLVLRNELTALKKNRQNVGQELDALATDTQGLRNRLRTEDRIVNPGTSFLVTSDGFAERLGLTEKRPDFVFSLSADDDQTLWARWDEKLGVYRINPDKLRIPGMAEHAALMSRFFARSYGSTYGPKGQSLVGEDFWMDFRNSIPAFLLDNGGIQFPLYKDMHLSVKDALNRLNAETSDKSSVSKLAISLYQNFSSDWSYATLPEKAAEVAKGIEGLSVESVHTAFKSCQPPVKASK